MNVAHCRNNYKTLLEFRLRLSSRALRFPNYPPSVIATTDPSEVIPCEFPRDCFVVEFILSPSIPQGKLCRRTPRNDIACFIEAGGLSYSENEYGE